MTSEKMTIAEEDVAELAIKDDVSEIVIEEPVPPPPTLYFVDADGNYLGGYSGAEPPEGAVEVSGPPEHGLDKWVNGAWQSYVYVPDSVSARQFKMQLLDPILPAYPNGIEELVLAFIAASPRAVQVSYENSGSFVRTEPMMEAGFSALGFTTAQIDEFFIAANKK